MSELDEDLDLRSTLSEYILETDYNFRSTKDIVRDLEEDYDVDVGGKQVGPVFRRLKEDWDATVEEFRWGSPDSNYDLNNIRETYEDELRAELDQGELDNQSDPYGEASA